MSTLHTHRIHPRTDRPAAPVATPAMPAVSPTDRTDRLARLITATALLVLVAVAMLTWHDLTAMFDGLRQRAWMRAFMLTGLALLLINGAALIWRIILVRRYRPVASVPDAHLPTCTVIVPAYNEGRQVLHTLRSLMASDYPVGRLQIIAINDGSKDDTWHWICEGARAFPRTVIAVNGVVNRGKRHALSEGFDRATGQVIVTVDSDSEILPDTLRNLVSPFVANPRVGGVAGNVRVLNRHAGLLPRMLDVSFTYSFDFIRAAQSELNTVFCTPGALSAYRADLVHAVRHTWLNQTYFGRTATIGEDRAMTNLILRHGHHVTYQRNAVVLTEVPTGYKGLCKMFLRWARSNVRETLVLCRYAFTRFRDTPATGARINLVLHVLSMTVPQLLRIQTLFALTLGPVVFGTHLLLGTAAASLVPATVYLIHRRSFDGIWAIPYGVFWLFGLSWIAPWALLTSHQGGWLTRQLPRTADTESPAIEPATLLLEPASG